MRYSTEPKFRKYVKRYGFLSFAGKFGVKYGKKLTDTTAKTGIDAAKTASKRVVQRTAEATGDLIGNKIADKITSLSKKKSKEKEEKRQEIYIPPEKKQKILNCFKHHIKMEYQIITNLLGTTPNELPRFITKKWVDVHDQLGEANDRYKPNKPIRFETSMLRSHLCDFSDAYIVVEEKIIVINPNDDAYDKKLAFENNAPFVSCI